MAYTTEKIRNVAIVGHSGCGKTSLAESMLFLTKATDRLGKVVDGNTVGDSDSEEIKRQITIYLAASFAEHNGCKINILDTPGFFDFAGEVKQALRVADAGIVSCTAKDGISVGFEKGWTALSHAGLPRCVYVSKIDEENGDFDAVFSSLRSTYGTSVCPMTIPIKGSSGKIEGVYDLVTRKGYSIDGGSPKEIPLPDGMKSTVNKKQRKKK